MDWYRFGRSYSNKSRWKKILKSFNKSNSPLPSNGITKIAVDKSNEKIYFATSKGVVAYNGGEHLMENRCLKFTPIQTLLQKTMK